VPILNPGQAPPDAQQLYRAREIPHPLNEEEALWRVIIEEYFDSSTR
jgi:hypothetical protein